MRSEQKQEIVKAKLKKARQQLNAQASLPQAEAGGGYFCKPTCASYIYSCHTSCSYPPPPTPANVPQKAQVGRPPKVAKPKPTPPAEAAGPMKATPPKPPVTRSKTRNQPAPANRAVVDPDDNTAAPVDAEYDTDELVEFPTDSEPNAESKPGEENAQLEEQ